MSWDIPQFEKVSSLENLKFDSLEDCHQASSRAVDVLHGVAVELRSLARGFNATFQYELSNHLQSLADDCATAGSTVHKATGGFIHQSFIDAQRPMGVLLTAALHGVLRSKEDNE